MILREVNSPIVVDNDNTLGGEEIVIVVRIACTLL